MGIFPTFSCFFPKTSLSDIRTHRTDPTPGSKKNCIKRANSILEDDNYRSTECQNGKEQNQSWKDVFDVVGLYVITNRNY